MTGEPYLDVWRLFGEIEEVESTESEVKLKVTPKSDTLSLSWVLLLSNLRFYISQKWQLWASIVYPEEQNPFKI